MFFDNKEISLQITWVRTHFWNFFYCVTFEMLNQGEP